MIPHNGYGYVEALSARMVKFEEEEVGKDESSYPQIFKFPDPIPKEEILTVHLDEQGVLGHGHGSMAASHRSIYLCLTLSVLERRFPPAACAGEQKSSCILKSSQSATLPTGMTGVQCLEFDRVCLC